MEAIQFTSNLCRWEYTLIATGVSLTLFATSAAYLFDTSGILTTSCKQMITYPVCDKCCQLVITYNWMSLVTVLTGVATASFAYLTCRRAGILRGF